MAIRISCGRTHSLAVRNDGQLYSWGDNSAGQLGLGTLGQPVPQPSPVPGIMAPVEIAAGGHVSLALMPDGFIQAWGSNNAWMLGRETPQLYQPDPLPVLKHRRARRITAGTLHCLSVYKSYCYAWGSANLGSAGLGGLGDGTNTSRRFPIRIPDLDGIAAVAASWGASYALHESGRLFAWGLNNYGQLGDGTTERRLSPVLIEDLPELQAISVGPAAFFAVGLDRRGRVWSWGTNGVGQLASGSFDSEPRLTPARVNRLPKITAIAAGGAHCLALDTEGQIHAWGQNVEGGLGDGTFVPRNKPVKVVGINRKVIAIAAGGSHSMAVDDGGRLWVWGRNTNGQLGDGQSANRNRPYRLPGFTVAL